MLFIPLVLRKRVALKQGEWMIRPGRLSVSFSFWTLPCSHSDGACSVSEPTDSWPSPASPSLEAGAQAPGHGHTPVSRALAEQQAPAEPLTLLCAVIEEGALEEVSLHCTLAVSPPAERLTLPGSALGNVPHSQGRGVCRREDRLLAWFCGRAGCRLGWS